MHLIIHSIKAAVQLWPRIWISVILALCLPTLDLKAASTTNEWTKETARRRVLELRREIARHDELYFKKAAPVISDFEYDTLKAELRALETRFPLSEADAADSPAPGIGDDRGGALPTHRHRSPMLSLDKAHSDEEVAAFHARVSARLEREDVEYSVEPKYDGIAVSLTYERGRLVRATTRGNGIEGDDITANALVVRGVAAELHADPAAPWPDLVELRGEIFLSYAEFARVNEERTAAGETVFANPRNLTAGSIRLQDTAEVAARGLELVCHGWGAWEPASGRPATLEGFRAALRCWGLPPVTEAKRARGAELATVATAFHNAGARSGFPTDGAVVKLERVADQEALGFGPAAPRWALARKFAPERAATRLLGITWQVGRTGVLTPVAELAPVELDGSTVARATLHNADEIARRDLRVGDRVFVKKAGEIIPAVVGVDHAARADSGSVAYTGPEACPGCGAALVRTEGRTALRCGNRACPAKLARRLEHLVSSEALDVAGLGPALLEGLVAQGRINSPPDLLRLGAEDLRGLPGIGAKSAEKVGEELETARRRAQTDGPRLLYALGWPGVGRESARRLAETFGGLEELAMADEAKLRDAGLGATTARDLAAYLASAEGIAERAAWTELGIGKNWKRTKAAGAFAGEIMAISGALSRWTRAEVAERLTAAGAEVGGDVTRRTTVLVVGAEPGEKLAKARARGIEIIDEAELARRLGELQARAGD